MKDKLVAILADLLDDKNMILYALFTLALLTPASRGEIISAMAAFWARGQLDKGDKV